MSDERLRRLARAAAADPTAPEAWALAEERRRTGDRRGHFAAVAALARAGSAEARRALEALVPHPCHSGWGGTRRVRGAAVRGTPRVTRGAVEVDLPPEELLLSAGTLLLGSAWQPRGRASKARTLTVVDPVGLRARWTARKPAATPASIGLAGDDVLAPAGRALEVLAAEDGRRRGVVRLPATVASLAVAGDRAVAALADGRLVGVDLLARSVAWERRPDGSLWRVLVTGPPGGGRALASWELDPVALDLDTGAPAGRGAALPIAGDDDGVVGLQAPGRPLRVEETAPGGATRWGPVGGGLVALTPSLAVVGGADGPGAQVLERATGRALGAVPDVEGEAAAADDVLYLLPRAPGPLRVHDLPTGRLRASIDLGLPAGTDRAWLVAFDGGVLAAVARGTTVHLARVDSA